MAHSHDIVFTRYSDNTEMTCITLSHNVVRISTTLFSDVCCCFWWWWWRSDPGPIPSHLLPYRHPKFQSPLQQLHLLLFCANASLKYCVFHFLNLSLLQDFKISRLNIRFEVSRNLSAGTNVSEECPTPIFKVKNVPKTLATLISTLRYFSAKFRNLGVTYRITHSDRLRRVAGCVISCTFCCVHRQQTTKLTATFFTGKLEI